MTGIPLAEERSHVTDRPNVPRDAMARIGADGSVRIRETAAAEGAGTVRPADRPGVTESPAAGA